MQRAEARVPRRLNPPPPPSLPESTHHSFLIRGISREHENSERKEGVNGRQKPVEFLLSSDSKLVNHDTYIYIFDPTLARPQEFPLIVAGVCVLVICQRVYHRLLNRSHPSSSSSSSSVTSVQNRVFISVLSRGQTVVERVLRGYYRGTRDEKLWRVSKVSDLAVAEVLESSVITVDGTSISHRFWGISRG